MRLRSTIFFTASNIEGKEFGVKSKKSFLRRCAVVYFLQGLGIIDHDESFLLGPIHPAHQDNSVIFVSSLRPGNKDWLSGKMSVWEFLDDQSPLVHIQFDNSAVEIEHILGHVGVLVRLSQIGGGDVGEVKRAVSLNLDEILDLGELPVGHVEGVSLHCGPVIRVRLPFQHHVNDGPVIVRTGIEVLQDVKM